jgi:hypothetical protein
LHFARLTGQQTMSAVAQAIDLVESIDWKSTECVNGSSQKTLDNVLKQVIFIFCAKPSCSSHSEEQSRPLGHCISNFIKRYTLHDVGYILSTRRRSLSPCIACGEGNCRVTNDSMLQYFVDARIYAGVQRRSSLVS